MNKRVFFLYLFVFPCFTSFYTLPAPNPHTFSSLSFLFPTLLSSSLSFLPFFGSVSRLERNPYFSK